MVATFFFLTGFIYYYWVKSVSSGGVGDFSDSDAGDSGVSITSTAEAHGQITPAGTLSLMRGGATNFSIPAEPYYHINEVHVNACSVGAVSNYLWTNVMANGEITAAFAPDLNTNGVAHWWLASLGFTNDFDTVELFTSEDLSLAVAQGEANVTNAPGSFGLYTSAELSAALAQGVSNVTNAPNGYGLYTSNSLLDLGVGDIGVEITNGIAELSVQLWQTDDLVSWTNIGGTVNWAEPVDADKKFYGIRAEP